MHKSKKWQNYDFQAAFSFAWPKTMPSGTIKSSKFKSTINLFMRSITRDEKFQTKSDKSWASQHSTNEGICQLGNILGERSSKASFVKKNLLKSQSALRNKNHSCTWQLLLSGFFFQQIDSVFNVGFSTEIDLIFDPCWETKFSDWRNYRIQRGCDCW